MRFNGVKLPAEVLEAQDEGRLVVFAGAGVSVPAPSNYPGFPGLVQQIGGGSEKPENKKFEVILGHLQDSGIDVHGKAQRILSNPDSKPNHLHYSIVKLFPSVDKVRVVTTNFDSHITTAAKEVFGDAARNFAAPVLPLGHDFSGIVYLHGNVQRESRQLVLTDDDFGRAYLTEGWARRFLRGLFSEYTVVFIGYSHDDTVLEYLARGLPPRSKLKRFAFVKDGDEHTWNYLRVTSISYPLQEEAEDRHAVLAGTLERWVTHTRLGALNKRERLHRLLSGSPPIDPDEDDYCEDALKRIETARFFTEPQVGPEWLEWVARKGLLDPLFRVDSMLTDVQRQLAWWIADRFVLVHSEHVLKILQTKSTLNPVLWTNIVHRLWRSKDEDERDPEVFSKWVVVLVSHAPPSRVDKLPSYLLASCRLPEETRAALLLFRFLTTPSVRLRPRLNLNSNNSEQSPASTPEVVFQGDRYWLDKAWTEVFRPQIHLFAKDMARIVTQQLSCAHDLLRSFGGSSDRFDPMSFHRSAIEPHSQDRFRQNDDVLVDVARDSIEFLLSEHHPVAHSILEEWADSESFLLKRLAIHAVRVAPDVVADKKLEWLISRGWLYTSGLKHEVFTLMADAYPAAFEVLRQKVVERALAGLQDDEADLLDPETLEYEKYNLVNWLNEAAPSCVLASQALEKITRKNPAFRRREHPDFDHWLGESKWVSEAKPAQESVDELLALKPSEMFDEILRLLVPHEPSATSWDRTYESDTRPLGVLSEAVTKDTAWGIAFGKGLDENNSKDTLIWRSVIHGFQRASIKPKQWQSILQLLVGGPELGTVTAELSRFLENAIAKGEGGIAGKDIDLALQVARALWGSIPPIDDDDEKNDSWSDRLVAAINDPAGRIALLLVRGIARKRDDSTEWNGLPSDERAFLQAILNERGRRGLLALTVLASQAEFLLSVDPEWTKENLLSVFAWSNTRRAMHAWHGFAFWGGISEPLLSELLPHYEQAVTHLHTDLAPVHESFIKQLASISLFGLEGPLNQGWFDKFLGTATDGERAEFARNIAHVLRQSAPDAAQKLWKSWIREYWDRRLDGVPVGIKAEELKEMIVWAIHLGPEFESAVKRVCRMSAPVLKHELMIFHELTESDLPKSSPDAVLRLLTHLLKSIESDSFLHCRDVGELSVSLADNGAREIGLAELANRLAELGCTNAATQLQARLDRRGTSKR